MLNAIQVAVAMERPTMIESLLKYGAEMPSVIVGGPEDVKDAEAIARILRIMDSFHYWTRAEDGGFSGSGSQVLP